MVRNIINEEERTNLSKYLILIRAFINKQIDVSEFEKNFLYLNRNENFVYSEAIGKLLSILYSDIDSFCGNTEIADYSNNFPFSDINEEMLRKKSNEILENLNHLSSL